MNAQQLIDRGHKDFILFKMEEEPACVFVVGGQPINGSQGKAGNIGDSFITTKSKSHRFNYFLSPNFLQSVYAKNAFALKEELKFIPRSLSELIEKEKDSEACKRSVEKFLEMVGLKLSDLVHFTSPKAIFLTGSMTTSLGTNHLDFLDSIIRKNVLKVFEGKASIEIV